MQDLFEFKRVDTTATGKINGIFQSTGIRSSYTQRLETAGYKTESRVIKTAAR
jgi:phosphopentomutase